MKVPTTVVELLDYTTGLVLKKLFLFIHKNYQNYSWLKKKLPIVLKLA